MNSSDHFLQVNGGNRPFYNRSLLDNIISILATVFIIVGMMILFLIMRELYINYQSPLDGDVFIARMVRFLSNMPFVVTDSGNSIVIIEDAAKILAFFLFFLFVFLFSSIGVALLKAGINILPRAPGKLSKTEVKQSVPKPKIKINPSTPALKINITTLTDQLAKINIRNGSNGEPSKQLTVYFILLIVLLIGVMIVGFIFNLFIMLLFFFI